MINAEGHFSKNQAPQYIKTFKTRLEQYIETFKTHLEQLTQGKDVKQDISTEFLNNNPLKEDEFTELSIDGKNILHLIISALQSSISKIMEEKKELKVHTPQIVKIIQFGSTWIKHIINNVSDDKLKSLLKQKDNQGKMPKEYATHPIFNSTVHKLIPEENSTEVAIPRATNQKSASASSSATSSSLLGTDARSVVPMRRSSAVSTESSLANMMLLMAQMRQVGTSISLTATSQDANAESSRIILSKNSPLDMAHEEPGNFLNFENLNPLLYQRENAESAQSPNTIKNILEDLYKKWQQPIWRQPRFQADKLNCSIRILETVLENNDILFDKNYRLIGAEMHINKKPFLDVISTVILHYIRNYSGIFKLGSGPIPMYPVMSTFTIFAMNSKYKFAIELLGCIVDLTRQSKNNLEYWSHCLTNDNIFILYKSLATIGYCAQLPISGEVAIDYPVCLRSALQLRMLRRGYSRCVDNELLESEEGKAITTLLIPVMNQLLKDKNYKELAALFELITQSEMYAYIQDKVAVADEFFSVFNALAPKKPDMSKVSDHIKLLIDDLTRMDFDTLESACKILHVLVNNLTQSHIVTTVYRQEIKKIITQLEMFSAHLLRQCMSEIEFKFEAYKANEEISDNDMCVRPVININLENNFETLDQVLRISQLLVTLSLERDRTQYNKMLRFAEEAHETAIQVYEKAQLINADKRYTLSLSEETTRKVFNLDDRTAVKSQQEWIISYLDSQKVLCKEYLQTHTKQKRKDTKQHSSPPARKVMGSAAESSNPQLSHHDFF